MAEHTIFKAIGARLRHPFKPHVRSLTPEVSRPKQKQPRSVFLSDLYSIYKWNYVVRTCVDAIAADAAKEGHEWIKCDDFPNTAQQQSIKNQAERLISHPNPDMTEHDLITAIIKDLLIGGDGWLEAVWSDIYTIENGQRIVIGQTPSELWPVPGETMYIIPSDATGRLPKPPAPAYKQKDMSGGAGPSFTADEIIHFSEGNIAGRLYGTPRLLSALMLIATQTQALRFNLKTFTGQRYPKAQLHVGEMNQDDFDRLIEKSQQQAQENPNGIMYLSSPAANLLRLIDSNQDMQFMELQRFVERSVASVYRVPLLKLGISETGGAGAIVGYTQMNTYWDNAEEILRQVQEELNKFFYQHMGLRAWRLKLKSARPELYQEQAMIEDLRIKNTTLTVNEVRAMHGLDPVPWGDEPPAAPAPAFSIDNEGHMRPKTAQQLSFPKKAVAPGRMRDSPLVDPSTERIQERTRSRMAGSWMRAREAMTNTLASIDVVARQAEDGPQITTVEDLEGELDKILAAWEVEAVNIMAEGNADAYAAGRMGQAADLEVEGEINPFTKEDAAKLATIQSEQALNPIRTYRGEQKALIEQAVADAYAAEDVDLFKIRDRIEDNWKDITQEETWKLDRIVRTSTNNAQRTSRAAALTDSGLDKCKVITANDSRVRPSHRRLHNKVIPIQEALRILNEPNCRCRIVKPSRSPKTAPSADQIAAAIASENGASARTLARASLGVE